MLDFIKSPWLFVIDTSDYAGNFERKLCAYCTGNVGECGVGESEALAYSLANVDNLFDTLAYETDEHGCAHPCTIFPSQTKGKELNSVAILFEERPTEKEIARMMDRANLYLTLKREFSSDAPEKILGFRLIRNKIIVKRETVEEYSN